MAGDSPDSWDSELSVGARGRNPEYEYVVDAIEGDYVSARLPDGTTKRLSRLHAEALDLGMRLANAALNHPDAETRRQAAERLAELPKCNAIRDAVYERSGDDAVRLATTSPEERAQQAARAREILLAERETHEREMARQQQEREEFFRLHPEARAAELRATAEANHQAYFADEGLDYPGVRTTTRRCHRVTHCWACHHPLDNSIDAECNACGWIICRCGACGCQRT